MLIKEKYINFTWSVGTTSFRGAQFNLKIEQQLSILDEFWNLSENANKTWQESQEKYYDFMKEKGFVKGNAGNKAKDAREKTSGLVTLGLLTEDRRLTEPGEALLKVLKSGNFHSDNEFEISRDSYIYLKQLLKLSINIDYKRSTVRPFILVLYLLENLKYLSYEEFTYLCPLCINKKITDNMINQILKLRKGKIKIDDILLNFILDMDNYKNLANYFTICNSVKKEDLVMVGINRKSPSYDEVYYDVYRNLCEIVINKQYHNIDNLYKSVQKLKLASGWKSYLFKYKSDKQIIRAGIKAFNDVAILKASNLMEFNLEFFKIMHLIKTKATLKDYFDLNRRYFKLSEIFIFEDSQVKLDIIPSLYFKDKINKLYQEAFTSSPSLSKDCKIEEISSNLVFDGSQITTAFNSDPTYKTTVSSVDEIKKYVKEERLSRFNALIDRNFNNETLINLLDCFEKRDDTQIQKIVTEEATVPTIFEYIFGIIWYKISNREGDILDFMNLSLTSELLPKTHAGGGMSDIEYDYKENISYPNHRLNIEVTLMDNAGQKLNEDEPVTRHLAKYRLKNPTKKAYSVFSAPTVPLNLISSFRHKKYYEYFDEVTEESISNFKIIPLHLSTVKKILNNDIKYEQLYEIFDKAYNTDNSSCKTNLWYSQCIENEIDKLIA